MRGKIDEGMYRRMEFYKKAVAFYILVGGVNLNKPDQVRRGLGMVEEFRLGW